MKSYEHAPDCAVAMSMGQPCDCMDRAPQKPSEPEGERAFMCPHCGHDREQGGGIGPDGVRLRGWCARCGLWPNRTYPVVAPTAEPGGEDVEAPQQRLREILCSRVVGHSKWTMADAEDLTAVEAYIASLRSRLTEMERERDEARRDFWILNDKRQALDAEVRRLREALEEIRQAAERDGEPNAALIYCRNRASRALSTTQPD